MQFNIRKVLLAGSAIVAVTAVTSQAQAAVVAQTLTGSVTWAEAHDQAQTPTDGTHAKASDTVDLVGNTLTVSNDQTANDGGGHDLFTLGAVTGTTGSLLISSDVTGNTGAVPDLVVNGTTVAISGAGNITVANQNLDDKSVTATFSGAVSTGGALAVSNTETTTGDDVSLTTGALTVTGATTITGGTFAGATSNLTVNGNSTFTGGVTVAGGAGAASNAVLNLNGATNTGNITLTPGGANTAILNVGNNTTTAQSVAGNVLGSGNVNVSNSSATGVTFGGTVGGITLNIDNGAAALNSNATFTKGVAFTTINLGGAGSGTGTNTATFDTTAAGFTLAGALTGSTANEVDNIVVKGGHAVTSTATVGGQIDDLSITGAGTTFSQGVTTGAGIVAAHVGTGATLAVTGGTTTITNTTLTGTGAVALSGGSTLTTILDGATDNTGAVNVTAGSDSIFGAIGHTHKLKSINIASGATLTATAGVSDVKATTTTLTNDATLVIGNGSRAVTTDVVGTVTNHGVVTFADGAGTTTFTGDMGTSDIKLAQVNILTGNAQTVTTTGNIYATHVVSTAADTLQFLGDGNTQTVSGDITNGILTVGNATTDTDVTFGGPLVTIASATVAANASAHFMDTTGITGLLTNNGSMEIAANKTLTTGTYASGTSGVATFDYNRLGGAAATAAANSAHLAATGAVDFTHDNVVFEVQPGSGIPLVGTIANVVTSGVGVTLPGAGRSQIDNSYLYNFALVTNGTNADLHITQANDIDDVTTFNGNSDAGEVLMTDLAASTNPEINEIQANLANASNEKEVGDFLESVQPDVGGGEVVGALQVTDLSLGVTNDRLSMLRTGSDTGMATGNVSQGLRMWGQVFGARANQDERDGVSGYDADTWGGAVGLDTENAVNDHSVLGVALSYGNTNVDSDNSGNDEADVDSYQITLYGDIDLNNSMFLNGQLAYGWNSIDTDRHDIGGVSGLDAHGSYDANTYSARADLGRDFQYDKATITPMVSADWTHFDPDSYTETGAGGANLHVAGDSLDIIEAGVGVDASWMYQNADGSYLEPKLHAGYRYNFGDDQVETSSSFVGGGGAFRTQGADPSANRFDVGAGIRYFSTDNWDLTANYNYEFREDYGAHTGFLRAAYKF